MKISRLSLRALLPASLAAVFLSAAPFVARAADTNTPPMFQAGDRWSAVGDSITHGGLYTGYTYLYYVTRFPNRRFEITNAGISGDTAVGAVRRFDWDIASYHPTVATIMLGMNDVGGGLYNQPTTEKLAHDRKFLIDRYATNLRTLATKLKESGARVILLTPSIFDQTVVFDPAKLPPGTKVSQPTEAGMDGTNDGLKVCAERVREIGHDLGCPVVDFNGPMAAINAEQQKKDPHYTLIGRDRVHPGPVGHFVMAYLLLKAQHAPQYVARLTMDARAGKATLADNCAVSGLTASESGVSFTLRENALPYPFAPSITPALDLVPFVADLDREPFVVTGLKPGRYTLKIDGLTMGQYDAAALASGIDLAALSTSPQYLQSLAVRDLDSKRNGLLLYRLRTLAWVEFVHEKDGVLPNNKGDQATLDKVTQLRDAEKPGYRQDLFNGYLKDKPHEAELRAEYERDTDTIWAAAQTKPHKFEIVPAG